MVCCVGFCRTPAALPPRAWTTCLCSIEVRENAAFWLVSRGVWHTPNMEAAQRDAGGLKSWVALPRLLWQRGGGAPRSTVVRIVVFYFMRCLATAA